MDLQKTFDKIVNEIAALGDIEIKCTRQDHDRTRIDCYAGGVRLPNNLLGLKANFYVIAALVKAAAAAGDEYDAELLRSALCCLAEIINREDGREFRSGTSRN